MTEAKDLVTVAMCRPIVRYLLGDVSYEDQPAEDCANIEAGPMADARSLLEQCLEHLPVDLVDLQSTLDQRDAELEAVKKERDELAGYVESLRSADLSKGLANLSALLECTPTQSAERIRNEALEEAASVADNATKHYRDQVAYTHPEGKSLWGPTLQACEDIASDIRFMKSGDT